MLTAINIQNTVFCLMMSAKVAETIRGIRDQAVIAVVRAPDEGAAVATCEALVRGGVRCLEIAYTTRSAAAAIREATARLGDRALIGAGTLLGPEEAEEAAGAGARFLVSPGCDPALIQAMSRTGAAAIPGVLSPSEVMAATRAGARLLKLFPATFAGPGYMRSLHGPFPDVGFVPTGGIGPDAVGEWLAAGAVAVAAGSEICPASAIECGDYDQITELARAYAGTARS